MSERSEGEVYPDFTTGRVISRFTDPDTGEQLVELHLAPSTARDFAYNLSRCAIAIEEHRS